MFWNDKGLIIPNGVIRSRLRKPSEDMTRVALRWIPEGKRKRGKPKTTWRSTIENEIKERGYT